ncbi:MAG: hypothetical protein M1827_000719 [Pycnora praestabilis]|nr:MAG: hypothetical protein M1827_000719 [Pycnora praestabilis]
MTQETKPWVETPLISSAALSKAAGCKVYLKLENLQPAGSFKSRGIGNYLLERIREHDPTKPIHFYSSSGGNAGLACVTAATTLGHPSTVIVPYITSSLMISKILTAGATHVQRHGNTWFDADTHLRTTIISPTDGTDPSGIYVPPFDHPNIWAGNATMVEEIKSQMEERREGKPDVIVCSIGGGGLFNGIMLGLDNAGWSSEVQVLALETHGADSLSQALTAGHLITLPGITSIATSLGATRVSQQTFEYGQRPNVRSVVLSDAEAAMGAWRLADDERMLVETACGVSVAVCYDGRLAKLLSSKGFRPEMKVVVVVCGGMFNLTSSILGRESPERHDVVDCALCGG